MVVGCFVLLLYCMFVFVLNYNVFWCYGLMVNVVSCVSWGFEDCDVCICIFELDVCNLWIEYWFVSVDVNLYLVFVVIFSGMEYGFDVCFELIVLFNEDCGSGIDFLKEMLLLVVVM